MHWKDPGLRRGYHGLKAYDQSKLAVVLFTYELARRVGPRSRGGTLRRGPLARKTGIGAKDNGRIVQAGLEHPDDGTGIPAAEQAAESVAWCAAEPSAARENGPVLERVPAAGLIARIP